MHARALAQAIKANFGERFLPHAFVEAASLKHGRLYLRIGEREVVLNADGLVVEGGVSEMHEGRWEVHRKLHDGSV